MIPAFTRYNKMPLYSSVVLADGPLAYWRLGESSGTVAADSSGNGYNGTYVSCTQGSPSLVINNQGNLAVSGNGTSSQITVGAVPALYSINRNFTIEAWLQPADVSGAYGIFSAGLQGVSFRRTGTSIEFLRDYSVSIGTVPFSFISGMVYHVVCVVDGSGIAAFYKNGAVQGTLNVSGYVYSGGYVRLGADGKDSTLVDNFLDGSLDELAVYNTALSASQILTHYNAGV